MKNEHRLKSGILVSLIISFFSFQSTFAQCTNPIPTGNTIQNFCKTDANTIGDLVASGGTIVWFDAPVGGNQHTDSTALFDNTIYYADDIDDSNCSTSRLAVTVNIYGDVPTNVDVFVGKCASDDPIVADLSATGTAIEWYTAQFDGALISTSESLVSGQTYWVQQTENGCTSDRLPTTVTIIDPPPPTMEPTQSFCTNAILTINDLQATGTNLVWYNSETSTIPLDPTSNLEDGEDYWATQGVFPCQSTARAHTMVQLDAPPNAGSGGSYVVCEESLVTTNLFELLGETPDATGTWSGPSELSNGYLGTFEPGINTIGVYTYTVESVLNICENNSATVTVNIITVPPPTISQSNQAFCEIDGATIADLNVSGTAIQWYDTDMSAIPLDSSTPLIAGEDYWASQTTPENSCESASRTQVIVSINAPPPPTTSSTTQSFCELESPSISNLSISGTGIEWYDSETSDTPLSTTDLLINGEDYWASQTGDSSNCVSASRLQISVIINTPPPPTTSAINQSFCEIDAPTIADLSATGNEIQWYDTETSDTPLENTSPLVHDATYWATQTMANGCESASRLQVSVAITTPPPPTSSASNQIFCELEQATVSDLNADGTGIQWYASETSDTPLENTDLLIDGAAYWASQTDDNTNCESAGRLQISVTINTPPPPTTSESNQTFCNIDNPSIADLDVTGNNIQWYDSETSDTPLENTELLIDGSAYWATQSGNTIGCESPTRLLVSVTIIDPPPPTTTQSNQVFCEIDAATIADLNATGNEIKWYDSETSVSPLETTDSLIDGEEYWATQADEDTTCESTSKLLVTVSIITPPPPTTSAVSQTFCEIDSPTIADLSVNGNDIQWYDTETSATPLDNTLPLVHGAAYWATQTMTNGCESATRLVITVTISAPPPPTTSVMNQVFCELDNPTIADLNAIGTGIQWYASEASETPLENDELLIDGSTYWASQINTTGCESNGRLSVSVTINNPSVATTSSIHQSFCAASSPTIENIAVEGQAILFYASENATTPLNTNDLLINGSAYWAAESATSSECVNISRLKITVSVGNLDPVIISNNTQSFCKSDNATVSDMAITGNGILWYAGASDNTPLDTSHLLVDGQSYWAVQSDATSECESSIRVEVTINLIEVSTPGLMTQGNEFCSIDAPTIFDLSQNITPVNSNGTIQLLDAFPNGAILSPNELLIHDNTYYAVELNSEGCTSTNPLAITVTLEACDEYDIIIYDGFSPTGSGINDTFKITNLRTLYPDFRVEFYNRWGNQVYISNASNGDWNGRLNGDGELLPTGVYYFIIYFNKNNKKPIQRRLYLSR